MMATPQTRDPSIVRNNRREEAVVVLIKLTPRRRANLAVRARTARRGDGARPASIGMCRQDVSMNNGTDTSIRDLLTLAKAGNREAFALFVLKHAGLVRASVRRAPGGCRKRPPRVSAR